MADPATYDEAIVETLRRRAVQSAILIDDRFPTFSDLLDADGREEVRAKYRDVDDARRLYRLMHRNQIVCDVENSVGEVDDQFLEKIRKSDLVVLDWNLNPSDDRDSEAAVRVLCGLSRSPHFNLVAIYTRDSLDDVWTRSAVRLRGGWMEKEELAEGSDLAGADLDEIVGELDHDGSVELVTDEMVREYVLGGITAVSNREALRRDFAARFGVSRPVGEKLLEILVHRAALKRHGATADGKPARAIEGAFAADPPFLNAGSVFVCLVSKTAEAGAEESGIFERLDQALIAWKPSVLQLLVSELQNDLDHHSYAFDHSRMPSGHLKAGWMFHMLREHGEGGDADGLVNAINLRLTEAIEESVRTRMSDPESNLSRFGRLTTNYAMKALGDVTGKSELELVEVASAAVGLTFSRGAGVEHKVLHALNEYLSADPFRGGHVTVGTVLCSADRTRWWMCVSPACDMVPRKPRDEFSWQSDVHPFTPMYLLKLQPGSKNALAEAEQGTSVFVGLDGETYYLRATDQLTRQPRPVTCMLEATRFSGEEPWQKHGFVVHEMGLDGEGTRIEQTRVFAVSQLRPQYAARFQSLSGGHQSRIGVDYVTFGAKTPTGRKEGKDGGDSGGATA